MKNSLKQLFRAPVRALLFCLLMTAATALLAVGSALYVQSSQRIAEVEDSFTTLGMIRQVPLKTVTTVKPAGSCDWGGGTQWEEVRGERPNLNILQFEGAEYLTPPENRPYYLAEISQMSHGRNISIQLNTAQVTALENSDPGTGSARVRVEKILHTYDDETPDLFGGKTSLLEEGETIFFCQCQTEEENRTPLQEGKQYLISSYGFYCPEHEPALVEDDLDSREYVAWSNPFCQQFDKDGNELPSSYFPSNIKIGRIDEITEDFWEPGRYGEKWEYWLNYRETGEHLYTVSPVNDLQLLPAFQNHKAFLSQGREITPAEFSSGAAVCMLPDNTLISNSLKLGDKITLSMLCSAYGAPTDYLDTFLWSSLSPFNAQGDLYEPFWEAEYEIVGTYSLTNQAAALENGEIANEMLVIPANSVHASDENNIAYFGSLKPAQATFQLPNGSIDAFETALHEALPELEGLEITYNDNGYEEIMGGLRSAWITSILLFAVGLLAAVAVILLLLYFFIVKQKKRTAIERSLGMTKRQCRVSLVSGILALTLLASAMGSLSAAMLINRIDLTGGADTVSAVESEAIVEETESDVTAAGLATPAEPTETFAEFSTEFSLWASENNTVDYTGSDVTVPTALFFVIPLALLTVVLVLSLLFANRNLKIEPIYLLSVKME